MANVKKALYNVAVFLVSLFITGSINVSNIKNTQDTSRVTLTVNETETLQEMNGWGAAAAWWAQVAGGSKNADDIAKLLYSKEGLGLNIYRYNVGSGEKQNPNSRLDPDSWKSTASFLVYNEKTGKYEYDWSQDANAMNMLKLCMSYGCIDSVVLFSNSPHFSMTVSGQASGGLKKHQNNLKPECYQEYVDYFLDITEHFLELGVPVKYISPINEPLVSWGGDNVYQEGCHYDEKGDVQALPHVCQEHKGARTQCQNVHVRGLENRQPRIRIYKENQQGRRAQQRHGDIFLSLLLVRHELSAQEGLGSVSEKILPRCDGRDG